MERLGNGGMVTVMVESGVEMEIGVGVEVVGVRECEAVAKVEAVWEVVGGCFCGFIVFSSFFLVV